MTDINQFKTNDRLDATLLAAHIASDPTPLGRGADGELYVYQDGVFVHDPQIAIKRVAKLMGQTWSSTVQGQVNAHLLNVDLTDVGLPDLPRGYLPYIVLNNGVYWWQDDHLELHSPALGAMTRLPITYDPVAIPHYVNHWLTQVLGDDDEMMRHIWEVLGYFLMTGNPMQKIFLFIGEGGNGKGTLMRLIRWMLGRENYSSISMHQLVDDRFASSGLYGKIANISGDLSAKFLTDPQILKEITGGDSISASRKHGQAFEFVPYAVPIFAANEFFRTSDTSKGWRRRWEVIDFNRDVESAGGVFDEQDLFDDAAGVFNFAMDGLRRLMDRGRFLPPDAVREATTRMHDAADPLLLWMDEDEGVYVGEGETDACTLVYGRYRTWCRRNGYNALASGPFGQRLLKLPGITKTRPRTATGSRAYHYEGIGVAQTPNDGAFS